MSDAEQKIKALLDKLTIEAYEAGAKSALYVPSVKAVDVLDVLQPTHQAEAKPQNPYICCVCHGTNEQHCDDCKDLCTMAKPAETTTYLTNRGQLAKTAYAPKQAKHILCICDDKGTICPVHNTEEFAKVGVPVDSKGAVQIVPTLSVDGGLRERLFKYLSKDISHEDSDYRTCSSHYSKCSKCGVETYHFKYSGKSHCSHAKRYQQEQSCTCGAVKEVRAQIRYLMGILDAHLQASVRDNKEDILHRVADVLSWHVSQGNIEMKHRSVEQIMQQLKQEKR